MAIEKCTQGPNNGKPGPCPGPKNLLSQPIASAQSSRPSSHKIPTLQQLERGEGPPSGFPEPSKELMRQIDESSNDEDLTEKVGEVPIERLLSGSQQGAVDIETVKRYMANPPKDNDTIAVTKFYDHYLIDDGHHRALARYYLGHKTIKATIIDITPEEGRGKEKGYVEKDRWITIGGGDCDPGSGEHCGGAHVMIDGEGKITRGPSALQGKPVDHLSDKKPKKKPGSPKNNLGGGQMGGKVGGPKRSTDNNAQNRLAQSDAEGVAAARAEEARRQSLIDQDREQTQADRNTEGKPVDDQDPSTWNKPESGWDIPEEDLLAEEAEHAAEREQQPESGADQPGGGQAGGADGQLDEADSGGLAQETEGPGDEGVGTEGSDVSESSSEEAAQDLPGETAADVKKKTRQVLKKMKRYASLFRKKGQTEQAEWIEELQEHIKTLGVEHALEALGEEKEGFSDKVQYVGAYDELGDTKEESDFIKDYLGQSGIILLSGDSKVDPNYQVVSSFSHRNLDALGRTVPEAPGDYIPTDQTFANKLEESQHLPGLESSEDVHKVLGHKMEQFTPEAVAKFDEKYGKGKWIVKSYGAEAYAGFGIFFPQRVKQIQADAKASMAEAKSELSSRGYKILKDESGKVVGVSKDGEEFKTGTPEYSKLKGKVQRLGKQAVQASLGVNGASLPFSPEDALKNDYGMSFLRGEDGAVTGIVTREGQEYTLDSPEYEQFQSSDYEYGGTIGHDVERAVEADGWRRSGQVNTEPKFMVQPAFEAVGVSDYDRAMGMTWETANEGRVHCAVRNGKAQAVPYATLVGRGDALPAVFYNDEVKAMEKAVEDAINQLPESERTGQLYAPDVMKTKDGWKVVELNPSAEGGGSHWLGENPFVIDALASHMSGREPQHVRFMRNLLKGKNVKLPALPTAPGGSLQQPAKPADEDQPSASNAPGGSWDIPEEDLLAEEQENRNRIEESQTEGGSDHSQSDSDKVESSEGRADQAQAQQGQEQPQAEQPKPRESQQPAVPQGRVSRAPMPSDSDLKAATFKKVDFGSNLHSASGDTMGKVESGGKPYFYKESSGSHEADLAVAEMGALVDIDVPSVKTVNLPAAGDKRGLLTEWTEGETLATLSKGWGSQESHEAFKKIEAKLRPGEVDRHILFAYLAGTGDRHDGNYMVSGDRIVSIDHEQLKQNVDIDDDSLFKSNYLFQLKREGKSNTSKVDFDLNVVREMAQNSEKIASVYERRGDTKAAKVVRDRGAKLSKWAESGNSRYDYHASL